MVGSDNNPLRGGYTLQFRRSYTQRKVEVTQHLPDEVKSLQVGIVTFELLKTRLIEQQAEKTAKRFGDRTVLADEVGIALGYHLLDIYHWSDAVEAQNTLPITVACPEATTGPVISLVLGNDVNFSTPF